MKDEASVLESLEKRIEDLEAALIRARQAEAALQERIRALHGLYEISDIVETDDFIDDILAEIVERLPHAFSRPEHACAEIRLEDRAFSTANYEETSWRLSEDILVHGGKQGEVAVSYLVPMPERDEGPFLDEERKLIRAVAARLGRVVERMRAMEALLESEERNRRLYESDKLAIAVVDAGTKRFLYANETVVRLYGYDRTELLSGMRAPDISAEKEETWQFIERMLSSERSHYVSRRMHRKKNGDVFPVEAIVMPSLLKGRNIFFIIARDISERVVAEKESAAYRDRLENMIHERTRRLEEEILKRNGIESKWERAEFVANTSREMIALVSRRHVFKAVNNAFCVAIGKSREQIIGTNLAKIAGRNRFYRVMKPKIDGCLQGRTVDEEEWIDHPVFGKRYYRVGCAPYYGPDGEVTHVSIVFHDITKRKKAEDDLRARSRELEETNTALRVVIRQLSEKEDILEEKLKYNVNEMVIPYIEKLKQQTAGKKLFPVVETLEKNLYNIVSPLMRNLSVNRSRLTPQEMHIAELIKQGKTSHEIALLLNISIRTVGTHRNNIRKKLKLTNQKDTLKSSLLSLS